MPRPDDETEGPAPRREEPRTARPRRSAGRETTAGMERSDITYDRVSKIWTKLQDIDAKVDRIVDRRNDAHALKLKRIEYRGKLMQKALEPKTLLLLCVTILGIAALVWGGKLAYGELVVGGSSENLPAEAESTSAATPENLDGS